MASCSSLWAFHRRRQLTARDWSYFAVTSDAFFWPHGATPLELFYGKGHDRKGLDGHGTTVLFSGVAFIFLSDERLRRKMSALSRDLRRIFVRRHVLVLAMIPTYYPLDKGVGE
ncbi:hypothetical protein SODALDRAFT_72492 [Sodiomyces alkalinus F11]|uniref:Uncharacterized protein n=1 Tax=Sodiomyces alkalinus (strain CBS 110278 / VKM F-3762 / F11) TaxID=1314773 RepID=A0A3N2PK20_SODAK|nr:hypothetical protein SODALDRAFT_72492 [Sodiomyces alkalinus F11]ROT34863.1 hypothetical protein SODALDRAFT_72492 [Sodiomyces alkalinus F11]